MTKVKLMPMESAPKDRAIILLVEGVFTSGRWDSFRDCGNIRDYKDQDYDDRSGWSVAALPSHGCGCCRRDNKFPSGWIDIDVEGVK